MSLPAPCVHIWSVPTSHHLPQPYRSLSCPFLSVHVPASPISPCPFPQLSVLPSPLCPSLVHPYQTMSLTALYMPQIRVLSIPLSLCPCQPMSRPSPAPYVHLWSLSPSQCPHSPALQVHVQSISLSPTSPCPVHPTMDHVPANPVCPSLVHTPTSQVCILSMSPLSLSPCPCPSSHDVPSPHTNTWEEALAGVTSLLGTTPSLDLPVGPA